MNELQIRLTGDITALQSALTKAKNTIKSFEDSTNKESEKGNVGFKRKIGLIEQLTNKSKALRTALSQATNEKDVIRYNQELEQTIKEMSRLNALGRQVSGSLGATSQSFGKATQSIGSANGVAQEFSRIIQDAPFGIIGIGNNLQQLTANFAQTSRAAGGAGAAIKASLGALISPANLLVLGISAVTAAFTAYQMGAFDFLKSNEAAKKSLNDLTSEIKSASANSFVEFTKIDSLRSIIEDETLARGERLKAVEKLQSEYPKLFGNADKELLLNGKLIKSYDLLKESILAKAKASIGEEELRDLAKKKEFVDAELKGKQGLLAEEQSLLDTRNKLTPLSQSFSGSDFEQAQKRIFNLKKEVSDLSLQQAGLQINIEGYTESVVSYYTEFEGLLDDINTGLEKSSNQVEFYDKVWNDNEDTLKRNADELNTIISLYDKILKEPKKLSIDQQIQSQLSGFDPTEVAGEVPVGLTDDQLKIIEERNKVVLDSFSALGIGIASSLDIGNNSLRGFVTTLLSSAPKIIQAVIAQAQASKAAAAIANKANAQQAAGNVIVSSTEAAKGLGPVGLALLPVLIAGGLALISSAFSGLGGGGGVSSGGGGGASSGLAPQIFTNQNTVNPPSGNSPNFNSGSIDFANAQSRLFVDVSGDKLRFILDRERERNGNG